MNATDSVLDMFLELAAISSPPGHEREVADRVHGFLHQLGLETDEDEAGAAIGSEIGNIMCRVPATVTCCSCIACNSADCVRGLARLISSAIKSCAKTGPEMKRKLRLPVWLSSSTSVPRMSDGMRSGVNWMRRASSPSTVPIVSTSFVFASPGTPSKSAWPPERIVTSACSTTVSWPNMTVPIAAFAARTCAAVDSAARTIMSSIFSSPSPPALGMPNSLLLSLLSDQIRATCTNQRLCTSFSLTGCICAICPMQSLR